MKLLVVYLTIGVCYAISNVVRYLLGDEDMTIDRLIGITKTDAVLYPFLDIMLWPFPVCCECYGFILGFFNLK